MGRKSIADTTQLKAVYCLKTMQGMLNKLKSEANFREYVGFEACMQIFEEHYGDLLNRNKDDNEQSNRTT